MSAEIKTWHSVALAGDHGLITEPYCLKLAGAEIAELRAALETELRRVNSYKTLVAAKDRISAEKDKAIASLNAQIAQRSEAVNTLASERAANARLTEELAAATAPTVLDISAGYKSGTCASDAEGLGCTIRLHNQSPAEAQDAFEALIDGPLFGSQQVGAALDRQAGAGQERWVEAINALLSVATAAYEAMNNAEERANVSGGEDAEYVIQGSDFTALSSAMDEIDALPDDRPYCTLAGGARASWALRGLFAAPQPSAQPAPAASIPPTPFV